MVIQIPFLAGGSGSGMATQISLFIQTIVIAAVFMIPVLGLLYFKFFDYVVELNTNTGSGPVISRFRARKTKEKGVFVLKGIRETRMFPKDNTYIYKLTDVWNSKLIRFWEPDQRSYFPIHLETNASVKLTGSSQQMSIINRHIHEKITTKYAGEPSFMEKYGAVIGLAIVVVGFVIVSWFMLEKVGASIELGNKVVSMAQSLQTTQYVGDGTTPQ